jgi:hypothetical protein
MGIEAEAAILADLVRRNCRVLIPFGDSCRYDLLIDREGEFIRIQCKTGRLFRGAVYFKPYSKIGNGRGQGRRQYTKEEIDLFAVYCPELSTIFYMPIEDCKATTHKALRVEPAKNGAEKNITYASQYIDLPT